MKKKVTFDPSLGDPANDKSSNGKYRSPKNQPELRQTELVFVATDSIHKERNPLDISYRDGRNRDRSNQAYREAEETQQQTPQTSCLRRFIQSLRASIISRQGR